MPVVGAHANQVPLVAHDGDERVLAEESQQSGIGLPLLPAGLDQNAIGVSPRT